MKNYILSSPVALIEFSLVRESLLCVEDYFSLSSMVRAIIISSLLHNS